MQMFIKTVVSLIALVLLLPFFIAGFLYKEIKDTFESGIDFCDYTTKVFRNWLDLND